MNDKIKSYINTGLVFSLVLTFTLSSYLAFAHDEHSKHTNKKAVVTSQETGKKKDSIVREGIINLKKIDKNKDGKVFQDQMDWNVISDTPGNCPLCNMKLEEVTLSKAKENLKKNGFKVK